MRFDDPTRIVPGARRGLTLVESVIAIAVLAVAITAVFSAMTAGTAHAVRSADELAATVAVEDLMARILTEESTPIPEWDGYEEAAGDLSDAAGTPLAGGVVRVGRRVRIEDAPRRLANGPRIAGWTVVVEAVAGDGSPLGRLERWIARRGDES